MHIDIHVRVRVLLCTSMRVHLYISIYVRVCVDCQVRVLTAEALDSTLLSLQVRQTGLKHLFRSEFRAGDSFYAAHWVGMQGFQSGG